LDELKNFTVPVWRDILGSFSRWCYAARTLRTAVVGSL
jgi:hypothetical protein